jgi:NAD(P)-dependent dehydrogenase (short-subunit alcohol dehydrogenase family)
MSNGDRVAVVTGAASGIGRAVAVAAARGCESAIDVDAAGLAAPAEPTQSGWWSWRSSPTRRGRAAAERAFTTFGDVHLMSNNAGRAGRHDVDTPIEDWRKIFDVNAVGSST